MKAKGEKFDRCQGCRKPIDDASYRKGLCARCWDLRMDEQMEANEALRDKLMDMLGDTDHE